MDFWWILFVIDGLFFVIVAATVLYMLIFAIASLFKHHSNIPRVNEQNRFIILIPAYDTDANVEETVQSVLGQTYQQRLFDIIVISDYKKEMSNFRLAQYPITLLTPDTEIKTRARALQLAVKKLPAFKIYDIAMILDAGDLIEPTFLEEVNNAYEASGTKAIQLHRLSRNRDTDTARIDSIFEEINNSIFRKGHVNLSISSALNGSGMAFDFTWFKEHVGELHTAGDDKELEMLLLRSEIFIDYFEDIHVYDVKARQADKFGRQRSQWISNQFHSLISNIRYLPGSIIRKQHDLTDKIIQWMLVPRMPMMAIIGVMSVALPFIYFTLAIKWWILAAVVLLAFAIATPDYLVDKNWDKMFLLHVPRLMFTSALGLFGIHLNSNSNPYDNKKKK